MKKDGRTGERSSRIETLRKLTKTRHHSKFVQVTARIILHNRARLSYFKRIKK